MRLAIIALLSVFSAVASPVISFSPMALVDLDKPGAMESVKRDQPEHHRRITQILSVASEMPCNTEKFGRVVEARYEARDGHCAVLLNTGLPAKRLLSFRLDGTQYSTVVTMRETSKLVPVR